MTEIFLTAALGGILWLMASLVFCVLYSWLTRHLDRDQTTLGTDYRRGVTFDFRDDR